MGCATRRLGLGSDCFAHFWKEVRSTMRKLAVVMSFLAAVSTIFVAPASEAQPGTADWKTKVAQTLPLYGHRNWILIVDSAYPLQASPGLEMMDTGADQLAVVRHVLGAIGHAKHVRPLIYMDAELPFVPDEDAPGAALYRKEIGDLLSGLSMESLPHEKLIANVDEASKQFHVLVLKTSMTIPYTSVFIRLDCKYWSADAEARMRAKMPPAASDPH